MLPNPWIEYAPELKGKQIIDLKIKKSTYIIWKNNAVINNGVVLNNNIIINDCTFDMNVLTHFDVFPTNKLRKIGI